MPIGSIEITDDVGEEEGLDERPSVAAPAPRVAPVVEIVENEVSRASERHIEMALVSSLLARPDLIAVVQPQPGTFADPTLRAMLQIVSAKGEAYTKPLPMLSALETLPQAVDGPLAMQVLEQVPFPDEVELGQLLKLRADVEQASRDRAFVRKIDRAKATLGAQPGKLVAAELRQALDEYDRGGLAEQDHTSKGALARLKNAPPKVRYRIAGGGVECLSLDEPFPGIGPDGHANFGMSGLGEVIVLAAGYGVGKTRVAQNWEDAFLGQGASIAHLMLEDDETAGMTKLMGIHADLPFWQVEQYARGEMAFLGQAGLETARRLDGALEWYESLGDRIRFYDGSASVNVFDFDQATRLLELDFRLYKTTHLIVDYVQAFASMEYSEQARYAQQLRALAGRYKVNVVEVSQVSNDTMKWGSAAGQVAAKGAGDWGQAAHIGIELEWDAKVGQEEIRLNLKKARNARRRHVYARVNETTGRIQAYYDTPMLMENPEEKPAGKGGPKGGKR